MTAEESRLELEARLRRSHALLQSLQAEYDDGVDQHGQAGQDDLWGEVELELGSCHQGTCTSVCDERAAVLERERDQARAEVERLRRVCAGKDEVMDHVRAERDALDRGVDLQHDEIAGLQADLSASRSVLVEVVEAAGDATPWPVADVLLQLRAAAFHLLGTHSCDGHGYEVRLGAAMNASARMEPALMRALAKARALQPEPARPDVAPPGVRPQNCRGGHAGPAEPDPDPTPEFIRGAFAGAKEALATMPRIFGGTPGWRDISSAPDGAQVLAWTRFGPRVGRVDVGQEGHTYVVQVRGDVEDWTRASNWMPLPQGPDTETEEPRG